MGRLLIAPALIINMLIMLGPALFTVVLAFYRWDGASTPVFVGFDNFVSLLGDRAFWSALQNNLLWTAIFLTVPVAIALVAGTLLLTVRKGTMLFQLIFFTPIIIATVVWAKIWQLMIYSPVSGIVNLANDAGIPLRDPLSMPQTALLGVAIVDIWRWWGFLAVIFFGALRQVPTERVEAARLDGAGFFQLAWYVLLPAIRPTIMLMMVLSLIWSFLVFDFVFILTGGGPARSSEVLATFAYRSAFYQGNFGIAAAAALVFGVFGLAVSVVYVRVQLKEDNP